MLATRNKHAYHEVEVDFNLSGNSNVLLAVHDQRTEMISTSKGPNFVGYMRSGVGIPYNISTKSGNALAEDISLVVNKGLTKSGFTVKNFPASPTETHEQLVEKMKAAKDGMPVILHLTAWHSDCYQMVWYHYNLVLQVYSAEGNFLGQKIIEGKDSLGGSFWNPPKHARKVLPPALKKRLEELFNSPEIAGILK